MSFHNAKSSGVMPLLTAMRYRVCPFCTRVVAPYLGWETLGMGLGAAVPEEGVRVTVLVAQAASSSGNKATANARSGFLLELAVVPIRFAVISVRSDPSGASQPANRLSNSRIATPPPPISTPK